MTTGTWLDSFTPEVREAISRLAAEIPAADRLDAVALCYRRLADARRPFPSDAMIRKALQLDLPPLYSLNFEPEPPARATPIREPEEAPETRAGYVESAFLAGRP